MATTQFLEPTRKRSLASRNRCSGLHVVPRVAEPVPSSRIFQAAVHGNTEMRMLVPPNGTSLSLSVAPAHLAWGCVQSTGEGGGWAVMLEPFQ